MKTKPLFCLLPLLALMLTTAHATGIVAGKSCTPLNTAAKIALGKLNHAGADVTDTIKLLRLRLAIDTLNYDDIVIGFKDGTSTAYDPQEDSEYLAGINAPEGFFSLSSDGVRLSVNLLPLPAQQQEIIKLGANAKNSGAFTIEKLHLDSLPANYKVWLIDSYKKDSLDMSLNDGYFFNIDKNDTASFGRNRFQIIIRQTMTEMVQLLNFSAIKIPDGSRTTWTTKNELQITRYTLQRSIDGSKSFYTLDSVSSNGTGAYSYTDKNPVNGDNLYRLKVTGTGCASFYSDTVTLNFSGIHTIASNLSIYPNPAVGIINLTIKPANSMDSNSSSLSLQSINTPVAYAAAASTTNSLYDIKIINITGLVIKSATSASASWQDNVSSLSPGTYIIQVTNNSDKSIVGKSTFIKM